MDVPGLALLARSIETAVLSFLSFGPHAARIWNLPLDHTGLDAQRPCLKDQTDLA